MAVIAISLFSARIVLAQDDDPQDEDSAQEQAAPPQYGSYNSGPGGAGLYLPERSAP